MFPKASVRKMGSSGGLSGSCDDGSAGNGSSVLDKKQCWIKNIFFYFPADWQN